MKAVKNSDDQVTIVEARVLSDVYINGQLVKADRVIEITSEQATELAGQGFLDVVPEAVEYARSVNSKIAYSVRT